MHFIYCIDHPDIMRSCLIISLVLIFILMTCGCSQTSKTPDIDSSPSINTTMPLAEMSSEVFGTYTNNENRYSVQIPSNWNIQTITVAMGNDTFYTYWFKAGNNLSIPFSLSVNPWSRITTENNIEVRHLNSIDEELQSRLSDLYNSTNIRDIVYDNTKISNEPAIKIVFNSTYNSTTYVNQDYIIRHGNKLFNIGFVSTAKYYEQDRPIFEKIIHSFTFLNN